MASRDFYESTIGSPTGDGTFKTLSGVRISVFNRGTTDLVSIFQRETGVAAGPSPEAGANPGDVNPFTTGTSGSVQFWAAAPGRYDIKIEDLTAPARISTRTIQWNAKLTDNIPATAFDVSVGALLGEISGTLAARPAAGILGRRYFATDNNVEYMDTGTGWVVISNTQNSSYKAMISAEETRTNVAYGLMPTADRCQAVVVTPDSKIEINYFALWKAAGNARAAIFIGANQIKIAETDAAPKTQAAVAYGGVGYYHTLTSFQGGLISSDAGMGDESIVATGQIFGAQIAAASVEIGGVLRNASNGAYGTPNNSSIPAGGPVEIFVQPGTYDISVQFKCDSGAVSIKNRRLHVRNIGFA